MKTIKSILINPTLKSIEIVYLKPTLANMTKLMDCSLIDVVHYDDTTDVCYVDDEGLLKSGQEYFVIGNNPQPLAGNALIFGSFQGKDSVIDIDPHSSLEEIKEMVTFLEKGTFEEPEPTMIFMDWEEAREKGLI